MTQLSLLPIELRDEFEADRSKSKDLLWTGIDDQDRRYALKTVEHDNPSLPLTEWVCYQLCMRCAMPAPDFSIVTRKDGSKAFGSRWEEDADQFIKDETAPQILNLWLSETIPDVTAMFALDAFLPNSDRHMGNILFRRLPRRRALAFDWSRTHLFDPWPLPNTCNTAMNLAWLRTHGLYSPAAWVATLDKLRAISHTELEIILNGAPAEWRTHTDVSALVSWWATQRNHRIDQLT